MRFCLEDKQVNDLAGTFVPGGELASFDLEIGNNNVFRYGPLNLNEMIAKNEMNVFPYDSDIGTLRDFLGIDADMLLRSRNVNPAEVQFELTQPTLLTGMRFCATNNNRGKFRLEIADTKEDMTFRKGSYSVAVPWRETAPSQEVRGDMQSENIVVFESPVQKRYVRFTFERTGGDNYVHLAGLRFFSRIPVLPTGSNR